MLQDTGPLFVIFITHWRADGGVLHRLFPQNIAHLVVGIYFILSHEEEMVRANESSPLLPFKLV